MQEPGFWSRERPPPPPPQALGDPLARLPEGACSARAQAPPAPRPEAQGHQAGHERTRGSTCCCRLRATSHPGGAWQCLGHFWLSHLPGGCY